jgi:hypothetical protein
MRHGKRQMKIDFHCHSFPAEFFRALKRLIWTLPHPEAALDAWRQLLRRGGRLILIEGQWGPDEQVYAPKVRLRQHARG